MKLFELFKGKRKVQETTGQNVCGTSSEDGTPVLGDTSCSTVKDISTKKQYCELCKKSLTQRDNWTRNTNHLICYDCYSSLDKFTIISSQTYLAPCAAAESSETLLIVVLDKCFLLQYRVVANGGYDNSLEIPFGFFATSSAATIADKLNSVSFRGSGFGIRECKKLTDKDILDNKEIERLVAFDKTKTLNA